MSSFLFRFSFFINVFLKIRWMLLTRPFAVVAAMLTIACVGHTCRYKLQPFLVGAKRCEGLEESGGIPKRLPNPDRCLFHPLWSTDTWPKQPHPRSILRRPWPTIVPVVRKHWLEFVSIQEFLLNLPSKSIPWWRRLCSARLPSPFED